MNYSNYGIRYSELELPRKIGRGIKMGITNKTELVELLRATPDVFFDSVLVSSLNVDTSILPNNTPINEYREAVASYYGVVKVEGHWEPRAELSADAKVVAQDLIDNFLK